MSRRVTGKIQIKNAAAMTKAAEALKATIKDNHTHRFYDGSNITGTLVSSNNGSFVVDKDGEVHYEDYMPTFYEDFCKQYALEVAKQEAVNKGYFLSYETNKAGEFVITLSGTEDENEDEQFVEVT